MSEPFWEKTAFISKAIAVSSGISLLVTMLVAFLSTLDFFQTYELRSLDFFQRLRDPIENPEVLLIEIDQKSLTALSEQGIHWPWPRQMYVPLLEVCKKAGAREIIFDIIFSEPSSYGKEDDLVLAEIVRGAGNVTLPMALSSKEKGLTDTAAIKRFAVQDEARSRMFGEARSCLLPIPELVKGAHGLGNVTLPPDGDGIYRKVALFTRFGGYLVPSLAVAPVKERFGFSEGQPSFDGKPLDLKEGGEFLLHFYGNTFRFPTLSALSVISAYQNPGSLLWDKVVHEMKDRYAIIALTAPGLFDLKPTAATSVSPGAYVHGILLTNLLNGHHIREMAPITRLFMMFGLGTVLAALILLILSFWKNSFVFLLWVLGCPMGSWLLFRHHQYWTGIVSYEVFLFFIFGVTSTYSYNTEGKKRRVIRRLFSQYMSEVLVKELEANPQKATLGGERKNITIFFSDLANFTTISERYAPERIVSVLNAYFTEMSRIILASHGVIDKYQGDGIMAFWGAPIPLADHGLKACQAALECQRSMDPMNTRLGQEGFPPLTMRIGLHSGDALVGNMGSSQRFDYTIIGDNVNLASRLEGVNKQFGTRTIMSETTYDMTRAHIEARELDCIAVKGKEKPIRIFQPLGERGLITQAQHLVMGLFEEGLALYRARDFQGAMKSFQRVLHADPDDQPAQIFIRRCQEFMKVSPPEDWDGVFRLKVK